MLAMTKFTLFEALRRGTLIFYFVVGSIIIAMFAFGLKQSPQDPSLIVFFGNTLPGTINGISSADFFMLLILRQSTFWIIVLGTFGSVGLMTSFLEKGTIELYLSKPFKRWELFASRVLGASGGVIANLMFCIVGIWLVFGLKLGVWQFHFLLAGLLVSYAFVCYFSIVSFVALWSRNTILSIVSGLFFAFASIGLEGRQHGLYFLWDNQVYHRVLDVFYYLTPQIDGMLTNAGRVMGQMPMVQVQESFSIAPYLYSLGASALFYLLSVYYFTKQDF
jgi:ABC-type transport system involved in multi-copper enzyme maturation permease subunit